MAATGLRVLTLAEIRQQVGVDWGDEDALLMRKGIAAEDQVIADTRRTLNELVVIGYNERSGAAEVEDVDDVPDGVAWFPPRLKEAMLLVAGELYKNREMSAAQAVNQTGCYQSLVKPYRRLKYWNTDTDTSSEE